MEWSSRFTNILFLSHSQQATDINESLQVGFTEQKVVGTCRWPGHRQNVRPAPCHSCISRRRSAGLTVTWPPWPPTRADYFLLGKADLNDE